MTGKCEDFCFQMPDKRNQILVIICQTKATISDNYAIFDLISTLKVQSIIKAKQENIQMDGFMLTMTKNP